MIAPVLRNVAARPETGVVVDDSCRVAVMAWRWSTRAPLPATTVLLHTPPPKRGAGCGTDLRKP